MSSCAIATLEPFFSGWGVIQISEIGKSQRRQFESEVYGHCPLFKMCCFMLSPLKRAMFGVCLLHTERNLYKGSEHWLRTGSAVQSCIVLHRAWLSLDTENDCS